ncbi:MAG: hypothetical protein J0L82_11610 [Deltaproteobacteria bacterium]|nr:hypothetical protein [Deltaproteobacteria bacterium]
MKQLTFLSTALFAGILGLSNIVSAAEIVSAELDGAEKNILIGVRHGGGCGDHEYSLKLKGCAESMPVQCQAELVHKTNDFCEALLHRTAVINLEATGIKGEYYSGGSLTIKGANGSTATITLPEFATAVPPVVSSRAVPQVKCTTHAGSELQVFETEKVLSLVTKTGEKNQYGIVDIDVRILESIPEVFQTRYKLDDGRTVVIEFRGKSQVGTGYFIRVSGDTSPNFPSCERL